MKQFVDPYQHNDLAGAASLPLSSSLSDSGNLPCNKEAHHLIHFVMRRVTWVMVTCLGATTPPC